MNSAATNLQQHNLRVESDSLGEVKVPTSKLWGAQTQWSLEHFSIGTTRIPSETLLADDQHSRDEAQSLNQAFTDRPDLLAGKAGRRELTLVKSSAFHRGNNHQR